MTTPLCKCGKPIYWSTFGWWHAATDTPLCYPHERATPAACEHDSLNGIDQTEGPDKVWRCCECDALLVAVTDNGFTYYVPVQGEQP